MNKNTRDAFVLGSVALALSAVVLANLVADRVSTRFDLTADRRYSLSEPFARILERLQDPLRITYFYSEDVPENFEIPRRDILDKLAEVENVSAGRVILDLVPIAKDNEELKKKLEEQNPDIFQIGQSVERDQMIVKSYISAIQFTYRAKEPTVPEHVRRSEELEYAVGTRVVALTAEEPPLIAIHFPPSKDASNPMLRESTRTFEWMVDQSLHAQTHFRRFYVKFAEGSNIPKDTQLLMVFRPKELSERAKYEISRYLAEGGRVFLAVSPWEVKPAHGTIETVKSGLEEYLKDLGVTSVQSIVCDRSQAALDKMVSAGFPLPDAKPWYVSVSPQNLNSEYPLTRFLPGLCLPYTSAFMVREEEGTVSESDPGSFRAWKMENGLTLEEMARTSQQAWTVPSAQFIGLLSPKMPARFDPQRPVMLRIAGAFPFPYEGKLVPPWNQEPGAEPPQGEPAPPLARRDGLLVLHACPDSFSEQMLRQHTPDAQRAVQGNLNLMANVMENYALGDELVRIRTKRDPVRGIVKFDGEDGGRRRTMVKLSLILAVPAVFLVFAFCYHWYRRGSQQDYERAFARTTGPSSFTE